MIKLTQEEITKRFNTLYNGEYEQISEYKTANSPLTIKHKPCGTIYILNKSVRFFNEEGGKCPKCFKNIPPSRTKQSILTEESLKKRLLETFNNEFIYISGLTKSHDKCVFKHISCEKNFEISPHDLFSKRFVGCPYCHISRRGLKDSADSYLEDTLNEAPDGSEYKWLESYKGSPRLKHQIEHLKCGYIYSVKPAYFRYGDKIRCPKCSRKRSKNEIELLNVLKEVIPYTLEESNRSVLNPYEIDIYCPEKKIGIEYNGLYWHCESQKGRKYHEEKRKKAESKGIRLIQIFEDEWLNSREIVISKIKSIFGIRSKRQIYARKCNAKEISVNEYKPFLEANHIQGSCQLSKAIGLFYKNELVAVGGFMKLRTSMNGKNIKNAFEMSRYATLLDTSVIGGCGKIISYFVNENNIKYIKTLADLRWSSSSLNMYIKLGFSVANYVEPRYFYTDGHSRLPRFKFRKSEIKKLFPEIYDSLR